MKLERDTFSRILKEELSRVEITGEDPAFWELYALQRLIVPKNGKPGTANAAGNQKLTFATCKGHIKPYLLRRLFYLNKNLPASGLESNSAQIRDFDELKLRADNRRGFLRGVFLARGSLSSPVRGHHLEMVLPCKQTALLVKSLVDQEGLKSGLVKRRSSWVVYIKDADRISQFLTLVGASRAVLQYENVRVQKDLKSSVQRQVNMDRANVSRSVESSLKQIEDIQLIDEEQGLHRLSPALREVARARLAHQALTMEELGQVLDPPISKSAVNHRFRRIAQRAGQIREKRKQGEL